MRGRRPPPIVTLVDDAVGQVGRLFPGRRPVETLPHEPFDLLGFGLVLVWRVDATAQFPELIEATARGVPAVVEVAITDAALDELVDQLGRIGHVEDRRRPTATRPRLADEHRELLNMIANGATLTAAASALGMSRRTATRRLAEARLATGADTVAGALRLRYS